ncbi:MAG: hypothetical protein HY960_02975 [Ignavibacteriae bacterium]|nr:hypothetical protein [Ignavibacteriota bacterium]
MNLNSYLLSTIRHAEFISASINARLWIPKQVRDDIILFLLIFLPASASSQQSPHGKIALKCETCHSTESWKMRTDASFNHNSTGFALEGKHKFTSCQSCHQKFEFTKVTSECASCHTDVHKSELGTNCLRCHSNDLWLIPDMKEKHQQTRFPLIGSHAFVTCEACHERTSANRFSGTPLECIACHQKEYQATTTPSHEQVKFPVDCNRCHQVTSTWSSGFNHNRTTFPLTGAHQTAICSQCHVDNKFLNLPSDCYSCHAQHFADAQSPNHVAAELNHDCKLCHTTSVWKPSTFEHSATAFPLTGKHFTTECQECHKNGDYNLTYSNCVECHQTDFQQASNPNHQANGFNQHCQSCHTTTNWQTTTFDHTTTTFALTGAHQVVLCSSCHTNNNFQLTYTNCYQCHQADFQQVTTPNHVAGNFNQTCQPCHSTTAWKPATFNHDGTSFPLTGRHAYSQCQSCHENGNYNLTYSNCVQCHQTDFQQATNPNHQTSSFNENCVSCHSTDGWSPASFDHTSTAFALTGSHVSTLCSSCHINNNYQLTYSNCYQCHQTDYQQVTEPNHVNGVFIYTCEPCHSTSVWTPSLFSHSNTNFALSGQHITTLCQSCHQSGNYNITYTDCYQCHQTDYTQATNPDHQSNNFNHDCTSCHSTAGWSPASFDHANTDFPLTGQHISTDCQSCHVNGNYNLTYTDCYQCHQTEFDGTTNPNHVAGNYHHDCTECHTTSGWSPASFDHTPTAFPLSGSHVATLCVSCHTNDNYQLTYSNCYVCHQTDYQTPTNPNHSTNAFDYVCQPCHTTTAWSPSVFNHSTTALPLTGAHTSTTCISCHTNGNYQLTYNDCYPCHQTDYQQPTNPNHVQANFEHDCSPCHTTSVWTPSTLNHDTRYFKIKSGKHRGKWTLCTECHTTPTNYGTFSCIDCHEHNRTDTDRDHREVSGYSYVSSECYRCHRND